ncbi:MAG: hypothetical protein QOF51_559 [Chloroflexota bacterium]|nr:hypothetical protein [Chloroflexota bacterium]
MTDWSGWAALGGQLTGGAAVIGQNADGRLEVFATALGAVGPELAHVWQTSPGGDWSDWANLGAPPGNPLSALALGQNLDGRLEVFGRVGLMSIGALWHLWQDPAAPTAWSAWADLGGGVGAHVLAVGQNADGRLEVFAVGSLGGLWHLWQDAATATGWSAWDDLGSPPGASLTQGIAVGQNADGRLAAFAAATDGAVWQIMQQTPNGGWGAWASLGALAGTTLAVPAVGRNADGRLEVCAIGANALWHNWQESPGGGWHGWESLGTPPGVAALNTPAVGQNADGRLEVFAFGVNDAVWHVWQDAASATGWSAWESLGGEPGGAVGVAQNADGRLEIFAESRLATGPQQLWHRWQTSPNGGWSFVENWELTALAGPASQLFTPAGGALLARTAVGLFRSADHGATWTAVPLPTTPGRVAVDPTNPSILYAGSGTTLQKSVNGGATWAAALALGTDGVLGLAVSPANHQVIYLAAGQPVNSFRLLRSADGGVTWTPLEGPLPSNLCTWTVLILSPHPTDAQRVFRTTGCYAGRDVPFGASLRQSTNQGAAWADLFHPTPYFPSHLVGGAGAVPHRYYLGSHFSAPPGGGVLYRSDDDGATWTAVLTFAAGPAFGGLAHDPATPDRVYAGLTDGRVQTSADAGATWDQLGQGNLGGMADLKLSLDGTYLYAATSQGVWRLHR